MTSQSALGEFVHPLVCGASAGFDHVEDAPLVGGETGDLASDLATEGGALADFLLLFNFFFRANGGGGWARGRGGGGSTDEQR